MHVLLNLCEQNHISLVVRFFETFRLLKFVSFRFLDELERFRFGPI